MCFSVLPTHSISCSSSEQGSSSLACRWLLPSQLQAKDWYNYSWKWCESDVTCGQVTHTLHLIHPKCTHTQQWTHTVNTHPEQWAANVAAPGEHLGVRCLAQGHLSRGIEGGRECCTFTPPTYNPCRTLDSNLQPLGYESDSLTIRPQLPHKVPTSLLVSYSHCAPFICRIVGGGCGSQFVWP